jgi:predicted protein tyrosine phosphatase
MSMRPLTLPDRVGGRVWLSPMPGRLSPWAGFLADAERIRLQHVVCLTPLDEMASLSPEYHRAMRDARLPFEWLHLPMQDFGVALEPAAFRDAVHTLARRLRHDDHRLLLHCAAGIGRTGTVAACLLKSLGMPTAAALQTVRAAGSDPQSAAQSGLIDLF